MVANKTSGRVAVVSAARTPFAKASGALKKMHVTELAAAAMRRALDRGHWPLDAVEEVICGNVIMPADATNPARVSALRAGIDRDTPALTVQRNCASGMEAVTAGAMNILSGRREVVLAAGAESMSRAPLLLPEETTEPLTALAKAKTLGARLAAAVAFRARHFKPIPSVMLGLTDPTCQLNMGQTAEILAREFNIGRDEQDAYALESHRRAVAAAERLAEEIVPVFVPKDYEPVEADVGPRSNQTLEALAKLKPVFDRRDGTVTVGNACPITDGAAAVLLMNEQRARAEGLEILGYVRDWSVAALDPARMGLGPVFAIDRLLQRTGMGLGDVDLFEINEAFAAQVLACLKAMDSKSFTDRHLDRTEPIGALETDRLNVNGGAIALGHPVGATGTRLILTLLMEMRRRQAANGVAALCIGGGQGMAVLLEAA